jgi:hypothetical protein
MANTILCTEITEDTQETVGFWLSADKQSSLDMSGMDAHVALAELLEQCGDEEDIREVSEGSFTLLSEED